MTPTRWYSDYCKDVNGNKVIIDDIAGSPTFAIKCNYHANPADCLLHCQNIEQQVIAQYGDPAIWDKTIRFNAQQSRESLNAAAMAKLTPIQ